MSGQEPNKAMKDISSRRLFAPYFKARWQNLQNIVNDSVFYSMIKEPYISYYQAYIKQWIQYSTGFVPMLHRQDFFSVGMGYTVCDIFTKECMNNGFRFNSPNRAQKKFIEDWGDGEFEDMLNQAFFFANAGGNALPCLTPINGNLCASVVPINRCIFEIGRRGKVTKALILNRFVSGQDNYYAREYRIFMDNKPYYKVELAKNSGIVTSPTWGNVQSKKVPKEIESQWEFAYGGVVPNTWYQIPKIKTLGIYNAKNKAVAGALSDLPGYSDSTLHTALDILYSLDYNFTSQEMDQYFGKSRVITPKEFQKRNINTGPVRVADGVPFVEAIQEAPLSDDIFTAAPGSGSVDGEPVKPFFMQPDLRGEAHKFIRDANLELLASKVGLSSSTLANHLNYDNSKTAFEVDTEQDTTEKSVQNKRSLMARAINAMLKDVSEFYGFSDEIKIEWNRSSPNSSKENDALLADYNAGTLPLDEYLKRRWPELGEDEIAVWMTKLRAENSVADIFDESKSLLR